jgi:hypothetical protein
VLAMVAYGRPELGPATTAAQAVPGWRACSGTSVARSTSAAGAMSTRAIGPETARCRVGPTFALLLVGVVGLHDWLRTVSAAPSAVLRATTEAAGSARAVLMP